MTSNGSPTSTTGTASLWWPRSATRSSGSSGTSASRRHRRRGRVRHRRTSTRDGGWARSSSSTSPQAARERGIRRFVAEVLPDNVRMLEVFRHAGYLAETSRDEGFVTLTFDITPTATSLAVTHAREQRAEASSVRRACPNRVRRRRRGQSRRAVHRLRTRAARRRRWASVAGSSGSTRPQGTPSPGSPATRHSSTSPIRWTWPSSPRRPRRSERWSATRRRPASTGSSSCRRASARAGPPVSRRSRRSCAVRAPTVCA